MSRHGSRIWAAPVIAVAAAILLGVSTSCQAKEYRVIGGYTPDGKPVFVDGSATSRHVQAEAALLREKYVPAARQAAADAQSAAVEAKAAADAADKAAKDAADTTKQVANTAGSAAQTAQYAVKLGDTAYYNADVARYWAYVAVALALVALAVAIWASRQRRQAGVSDARVRELVGEATAGAVNEGQIRQIAREEAETVVDPLRGDVGALRRETRDLTTTVNSGFAEVREAIGNLGGQLREIVVPAPAPAPAEPEEVAEEVGEAEEDTVVEEGNGGEEDYVSPESAPKAEDEPTLVEEVGEGNDEETGGELPPEDTGPATPAKAEEDHMPPETARADQDTTVEEGDE